MLREDRVGLAAGKRRPAPGPWIEGLMLDDGTGQARGADCAPAKPHRPAPGLEPLASHAVVPADPAGSTGAAELADPAGATGTTGFTGLGSK